MLLVTVNVVFHESARLQCNVPIENFNPQKTQKWGKGDELLTTNTNSVNNSKYTSEIKENRFILTIQDFSEPDVNEVYYCYYDFETVPYNLTMQSDWLLKPSKESLHQNISFEDSRLNIRLTLKEVFPVPTCNCTFDEMEISNKFVRKISFVDIFYSVDFFLSYNTSACGRVNITCALKTDIIVHETRNFCQDITESGSSKSFIIIGISITCVICMFIAVVIRHKLIKEQPEDTIIKLIPNCSRSNIEMCTVVSHDAKQQDIRPTAISH